MPQMKPINWMMLFLFLNMILFLMNILNYFFLFKNLNKKTMLMNKNFLNWNW